MFRWCTERLKIKPADEFIFNTVSKYGEAIVVLGVRKEESTSREQSMNTYKIKGSLLSRHSKFSQAYVYTPIEEFTVDDVWSYLLQKKSPWGGNNRELLTMYSDKNSGECPLVVDNTSPSCGGSRFGCWTCTLVKRDKSMDNLISSGEKWMQPLSDFRVKLYETTDPKKKYKFRDFKSRRGFVRLKNDGSGKIARGPYKFSYCKELLLELLKIQKKFDGQGIGFQVINENEIHEIRKIWRNERNDWEDSIPKMYESVLGKSLNWVQDDFGGFSVSEKELLKRICEKNNVSTDLILELLDVEKQFQGMTRRANIYAKLGSTLKKEWRSEEEFLDSLKKKDENK
jgi:DNA sulfur modification protein DndC